MYAVSYTCVLVLKVLSIRLLRHFCPICFSRLRDIYNSGSIDRCARWAHWRAHWSYIFLVDIARRGKFLRDSISADVIYYHLSSKNASRFRILYLYRVSSARLLSRERPLVQSICIPTNKPTAIQTKSR